MKKLFFLFAIFLSFKASGQFFRLGASQILYGQGLTVSASGDSLINTATGGSGSSAWGSITGTLNNQTDLQIALNAKLNISDTAAMLSHYAELSEIALKLNISDTAAMLANYAELSQVGEVNTGSNLGGGLANYSTKVGVDLQFNSFKASDFDLSSNVIGIDYTNAQAATSGQNGFLSATDWSTFNNKQSALTITTVGNNLIGLTNPSAITFIRINADNTVTARSAANFRSDIGAGTGDGTVTSVSGTANRITSTGGNTPALDISATFEALLGKVTNRIDQNNASTTSAQLRTVLSDELGNGADLFDGATPTSFTLTNATGLPLTSGVTGSLPIANGGTAGTTAATARTNLGTMYTMFIPTFTVLASPADGQTRYWSLPVTAGSTTAAIASSQWKFPYDCTVIGFSVVINCNGGSAETFSMFLRLNNTTDITLSSVLAATTTGNNTFVSTGLSGAVTAGDVAELKVTFPAWSTNPTSMTINTIIYFQ